jgi:hypothetical protein
MRLFSCSICALVAFILFALSARMTPGQQRMSDKDVEGMMNNLKEDAKQFRSDFNSAIGKSTIRNTDQEKQAKALAERFQKQTEELFDSFKDTKKADTSLPPVRDSASQIDKLLSSTTLNSKVSADWAKVKSELAMISSAFGVKNQPTVSSSSA